MDGSEAADSAVAELASTAVVPPRTPQQVLNIVYLNAGAVSSGGFFPNGMNGSVITSG